MQKAILGVNVRLLLCLILQAIYILSLIYAWKWRPAGQIFSEEGEVIGENYGVTTWDLIGLVLFSLVSYVFYYMVRNCLDHGLTPGYTLDIFVINLASQLLISFTRYGWWVYSLVPAYLLYKLGGYAWGYITNINNKQAVEQEQQKVDPKEAKRIEKQKRKEERPKVKYVR